MIPDSSQVCRYLNINVPFRLIPIVPYHLLPECSVAKTGTWHKLLYRDCGDAEHPAQEKVDHQRVLPAEAVEYDERK